MTLVTPVIWRLQYFFNGMTKYNLYPFPAYITGSPVVDWIKAGGWQLVIITLCVMATSFIYFIQKNNFAKQYFSYGVEALTWKQMLAMTVYSTACILLISSFFLTEGSITGLVIGATMAIGMFEGAIH